MKASEAKLQAILNSPNRYIVPVFQRYYSWVEENWEQLWEDIVELMDAPMEKQNTTHFMGALVFVPEQLLPDVSPTFQIIDGQQRMITIALLLCALRNIAKSYDFIELATEVNNTFLVHPYNKGLEWFRVYPRHQDKEDFEIAIRGEKEPENTVGEALSFFTKKILENPHLTTEQELRGFFQLLGSRLEFVHITLSKENPYRIFKSLNSTGVELDEGDLIRNYVFMHLPTENQEEFDEKLWKPLESKFTDKEGNLDGKLISAFFRDFLMRNGEYVRQSVTYQTFEETYQTKIFDPYSIISSLHESADFYNIIRGVIKHPNKNAEKALTKLRDLDSSTTYPLVLKLMLLKLPDSELLKAIEWLSSFIFRRFICQESSRAYGRWFVSACNELKENPIEKLRMFLISKGFPGNVRFEEQLFLFRLFGSRYTKAILARLERSLGHKEPVVLDDVQVEHIMPQTLTKIWRKELDPKTQNTYEMYLHTIGNLTLTGYNQPLSNKPFVEKKKLYKVSNITLTKMVAKYDKWNEESINERAKYLIGLVKTIWKELEIITPLSDDPLEPETNIDGDSINKIRKMISRIDVSKGQLELYRVLYEAGNNGLSWSHLSNKMGRSKSQLAGVLGALGMRINKTEGLDDNRGIGHILDLWEVGNEWFYRLKPIMREAIELEGIIK
jgi:hypothetical protein